MGAQVNETLADVIDELAYIAADDTRDDLHNIVARLRRAHGKEVYEWYKANRQTLDEQFRDATKMIGEATTEKSSAVVNMAKAREALEKCANMGEQIDCQLGSSDETVYAFRHERCLAHNISECARAALSAPARNCDSYTEAQLYEILMQESKAEIPDSVPQTLRVLVEDVAKCVIKGLFAEAKGEAK